MSDKFDFKKLALKKTGTPKTAAKPKKRVVYQEVEEAPVEAIRQQTINTSTSSTTAIEENATIAETKVVSTNKVQKSPKEKSQKVGRKSWKEEGVTYTRMAFDTPDSTKQKIKQLLAGKFYDKCISQDEMINIALKDFIKKHYKD